MWAWEHPNWPNFHLDEGRFPAGPEIEFKLAAGRLFGNTEAMREDDRLDCTVALMLSEAIATSAIEGEKLDRDSVRSALLQHFGGEAPETKTPADKRAAGAAALIVEAREKWNRPLTKEVLAGWKAMAVPEHPSTIARPREYRKSGVVIASGRAGRRQVHYRAPPAARVEAEMERFLDWYNNDRGGMEGIVRASVAHLWFERIHPFDDGNGRVGRAVADHALSQSLGRPTLACLSTAIAERRKEYYAAFGKFDGAEGLDVGDFVDYFTGACVRAQEIAAAEVAFVLEKSRFLDKHRSRMNDRQGKAVERMFREGRGGFKGGMTASKYRAITKCSSSTSARDLARLCALGVFTPSGEGRSRRYALTVGEPRTPLLP